MKHVDSAYCYDCGTRELPQHDKDCKVLRYSTAGILSVQVTPKPRETPDMALADQWVELTKQLELRGGLEVDDQIHKYLRRENLEGAGEPFTEHGTLEALLRAYPHCEEEIYRTRGIMQESHRDAEQQFSRMRRQLKRHVRDLEEKAASLQREIEELKNA